MRLLTALELMLKQGQIKVKHQQISPELFSKIMSLARLATVALIILEFVLASTWWYLKIYSYAYSKGILIILLLIGICVSFQKEMKYCDKNCPDKPVYKVHFVLNNSYTIIWILILFSIIISTIDTTYLCFSRQVFHLGLTKIDISMIVGICVQYIVLVFHEITSWSKLEKIVSDAD